MQKQTLIPAQLFVGPETQIYNDAIFLLQKHFCKNNNSPNFQCSCSECLKLKSKQHPSVVWLDPEKGYTINDISIVFEKTKFVLEANQHFFFIFHKAHQLNLACANRLLKILEEPPVGYRFLLLANNAQAIIPTIRSRCAITQKTSTATQLLSKPLASFFFSKEKLNDPIEFDKELKQLNLTNLESIDLLNEMICFVSQQIIEAYKNNEQNEFQTKHLENIASFLKKKLKMPPQPGSSTIFWKSIFMQFPRKG